jgi:mono/diheme cytochrome c family protein
VRKNRFLVAALAAGALAATLMRSPSPATPSFTGASVYLANCSGCHGASGQGAINIAPPLAKNHEITGDPKRVIAIVGGGLAGPIKENGITWSGSMPGWWGTLSNAQIAAAITYIRTSWGNKGTRVAENQVAALNRSTTSRPPAQSRSSAPVNVAAGESLYVTNCSGCHGVSGEGAVNIAPPLAKNPYVAGSATSLIRAVTDGLVGPVKEKGATWNGSMPAWRGTLTNAQIAAVLTYIRGSWGNSAAAVTEKQVSSTR